MSHIFNLGLKPIFHWKRGSCWLPNANEINTEKHVHSQRQNFAFGTQRNLYSTFLCWGFALGDAKNLQKIPTFCDLLR